ncbi:MAG TPA: hypothetical protein VE288_04910 [Rubrobacteraceae bacterium]|nr:hypothetical protein [Rubrobacteraceae bacterium]
MQYLVTQEYVDPGPLLPPEQLVGIMRMAVLPGHEAMENLRSEGKILAGGFIVGERAIAFILEADSPEEVDSLLYGIPFWGVTKTNLISQNLSVFWRYKRVAPSKKECVS